ncbi:hypothetical protein C7S16_1233 [Burkholderia thailandensis]|uniref:Uncharacterized protein n=1 Tax=Burkholderia thailandensis TaxID=57975 RepID=A0AAW9CX44_BURTH|nr:hypothetical protein [Burkholderia thailandensis]MDW9254451.1 hypothetical protein [Burkholderia thailandensis]
MRPVRDLRTSRARPPNPMRPAGGRRRDAEFRTAGRCRRALRPGRSGARAAAARSTGRPLRGGRGRRRRDGLIVSVSIVNIRFVYKPYKFERWE